jgi:hypothetical protein
MPSLPVRGHNPTLSVTCGTPFGQIPDRSDSGPNPRSDKLAARCRCGKTEASGGDSNLSHRPHVAPDPGNPSTEPRARKGLVQKQKSTRFVAVALRAVEASAETPRSGPTREPVFAPRLNKVRIVGHMFRSLFALRLTLATPRRWSRGASASFHGGVRLLLLPSPSASLPARQNGAELWAGLRTHRLDSPDDQPVMRQCRSVDAAGVEK